MGLTKQITEGTKIEQILEGTEFEKHIKKLKENRVNCFEDILILDGNELRMDEVLKKCTDDDYEINKLKDFFSKKIIKFSSHLKEVYNINRKRLYNNY